MELTTLSKEKKALYRTLDTYQKRKVDYEKRRIAIISKYGKVRYNKMITNATNKIEKIINRMNTITLTRNKLIALDNAIAMFTGTSVRSTNTNSSPYRDAKLLVAKSIFYKYGLENGMTAIILQDHIGSIKAQGQAAKYRREFTKSFETNSENKQLWLNFKKYYEEYLSNTMSFTDNRRSPGA
jgi:hypothetical protein